MRRINMKITINDENLLEIKINGEIVEGERKIQNRVKKEVKKEGLKKWKANMEKEKSLRWCKNKEKNQ